MCGITARAGVTPGTDKLLNCLRNLEYRGYDSAGIALTNGRGVEVFKRAGELDELVKSLGGDVPQATVGIGHTRWSTHGAPTDENAHPHTDCSGRIAVVHNGIIENYDVLRDELIDDGHTFTSDTDTEVVPHLVERCLSDGLDPELAFRRALGQLEGSFALAMTVAYSDTVYVSRSGSPLVIGVGTDEFFVASDVPAFLEDADRAVYLEDGDVALVTAEGYRVTDIDGRPIERTEEPIEWRAADAKKAGFDHYMLKEIYEQPAALTQTINGRISDDARDVELSEFPPGEFEAVEHIQFVACGTSYHAALYGQQLLARRGVGSQAFRAGEYATAPAPIDESTLVIGVTQSGETADTLESLRRAADGGARTMALTNVVGSTAAREFDDTLLIRAGPEIGVAATKTFSSQVATLVLLAERIGVDRTGRAAGDAAELLGALRGAPAMVERVLEESTVAEVCDRHRRADAYFFIGRGFVYPVALEGALKFKEITYEFAEGFAAGQLKHGPLALVTEKTPIVAVFSGEHDRKTLNNVQEVKARGAPIIAVAPESADAVGEIADRVLTYPDTHTAVSGILANVQLQLLAYHMAAKMGRPIDKPRNLAKSVTVE